VLALLLALALAQARLPEAKPTPAWSSWPALGSVTTPFSSFHPGIDIGILRSLAVEGYGNVIEVADGGGFTTLYAHLAGWRVRVGQRIWAGERIGTAGCTGWCTGTHLHFEMRLHGKPVNPLLFRRETGGTPAR
jgi:murein DD-endopeptidase MepM/ murein hydrolase activator NlpD